MEKEKLKPLVEDDLCPECGEGFLEYHCHRFSTERGPNLPDCDWLACDTCDFHTEPS